jgi:type IX secretion system substrate protein
MKKQLLSIMAACTISIAIAQPVPNGGFENWIITNYEVPQYYQTSSFNNVSNNVVAPYNAIQTTDAYHGNYAIQLNTVATGTNIAFAFVANGQPTTSGVPQGGTPYTQQATGIRFYYKSNIVSGDTAIVIAQFKKAHALIGTYLFKISSTKSSYTLFSSAFSPALTMAPDTVLFAAASSNVLSGAFAGIVGDMLQLDSVSFTGVTAQPANLNGDFELWMPQVNYNLAGWNVSDLAKQTTDSYSGSYALELTTGLDPHNNFQPNPGYATTGNNSGWGGYPYTQQHDTLVFYYKYAPASGSNDTAAVCAEAKLAGSYVGGQCVFLTASATYKMVKIPLQSSSVPDTLLISAQSSKNSPAPAICVGSDLKIDNMYVMSNPLGIKQFMGNSAQVTVYPNPAKGMLNVELRMLNGIQNTNLQVTDMLGNTVKQFVILNSEFTIDVSDLNEGVYNISVTSNEGTINKRIVLVK